MSVLDTPRIYFKGEISWDPITTNNYSDNYDEDAGETKFQTVAGFRRKAIDQVMSAGNWNPHGTHRSSFFQTTVNGFDLGEGVRDHDPFVSIPVNFTGMLVDLEPYGGLTSQLFFDSMQFGVQGGYRIFAPRRSRVTARYLNFGRNTSNTVMIAGSASVVWQTSFAKEDGLVIEPFDSELLAALAAALEPDDVLGLTVRFNTYRTVYFDEPTLTRGSDQTKAAERALHEKLQGGGFQPNPARSLLVGVLGLWRHGEPMQEPGDRVLVSTSQKFPLGEAHARINATGLVLDLSNTIPEINADLTKEDDLGELRVVALDPDQGTSIDLADIATQQYERAAYEASAGIVTVPLDAGILLQLATQNLQLTTAHGTVLLAEAPLRAVPFTPNLYLDEGDHADAAFQVYERGKIAPAGLPVTLYRISQSGRIEGSWRVRTDPNGRFSHPVNADTARILSFVPAFSDDDAPTPGGGINPQLNTYIYIRIRPADDALATVPPTWDNVYALVLANWNAMAPCMDNWLQLNDPAQVKAHAAAIKRLTDPAAFESYRSMPVTRDMSIGERTLLYKFLETPDGTDLAMTTEGQQRPTFAALSRATRVR
jgi:hypothetical protein